MQHSVQHTSEYSHFRLSMSRPMFRPTNKFLPDDGHFTKCISNRLAYLQPSSVALWTGHNKKSMYHYALWRWLSLKSRQQEDQRTACICYLHVYVLCVLTSYLYFICEASCRDISPTCSTFDPKGRNSLLLVVYFI